MSASFAITEERHEPRSRTDRPNFGGALRPLTLSIHNAAAGVARDVPLTFGVPFPYGVVRSAQQIQLLDEFSRPHAFQAESLCRWPDGSIRWLLIDTVAAEVQPGITAWSLACSPDTQSASASESAAAPQSWRCEVKSHSIRLSALPTRKCATPPLTLEFPLTDHLGQRIDPVFDHHEWETDGPLRRTLAVSGHFPQCRGLRFHARLSLFAGTPLVRLDVRLHNPNRARHEGGLWDLGDPGSILFRDFAIDALCERETTTVRTEYQLHPSDPLRTTAGTVSIVQYTSGAAPFPSDGYSVRTEAQTETGRRATPTIALRDDSHGVAMAIPEFWQQFPKSLESDGRILRAGLFPEVRNAAGAVEPHELQGGEQKSHTVWLSLDGRLDSLECVHSPVRVTLDPECHAAAQSPSIAVPESHLHDARLTAFLRGALSGEQNLAARRDRIDEYGWRNYGELPADHEQEHYPGQEPVVSHYNNQFDVIYGAIVQLCRTGDPRWFDLFDPLARHVADIDLYHTDLDRAAYNGGLFWHTDHYRSAGTATHRAYSRINQQPGRPYGGGPSAEHNYTTGLLHHYFLTGNRDSRDAVLSLADWVIAMEDGRRTPFALADHDATGHSTATADADYHGPGRGAGNSLNALTDAWNLTRDERYANAAEVIIRRVIHPQDDIDALGLLDAELRWSYTVFLVALDKWLGAKADAGQLDAMYAYGQQSLLHYARWMALHERPYFDRREELEYPTATWPAQELRKANVFRLAARHADEPERAQLLARGESLAQRAWNDLEQFDNRFVARCLSILLTEGAREAWLRTNATPAPRVAPPAEWPVREPFVPQKSRIRASLRKPASAARLAVRLLRVWQWPQTIELLRTHL